MLIGLIVAGIWIYFGNDCVIKYSQNMSDEEIQYDKGNGWIPAWMPEAASKIHYSYNIDTNNIVMKFQLPSDSILELFDGLESASRDVIVLDTCGADWWKRKSIAMKIKSEDLTLYQIAQEGGVWYLVHSQEEVNMWYIPKNNVMNY